MFVGSLHHRQCRQAGSSLVSVLVGVFIGGLVLGMLTRRIDGALQSQQVVLDDSDRQDLRTYLAIATDCAKAQAACAGGGYIQVLDGKGNVLIKKYVDDVQATKFGIIRVRAKCASTHPVIEAAVRKGGPFWGAYADLYPSAAHPKFCAP